MAEENEFKNEYDDTKPLKPYRPSKFAGNTKDMSMEELADQFEAKSPNKTNETNLGEEKKSDKSSPSTNDNVGEPVNTKNNAYTSSDNTTQRANAGEIESAENSAASEGSENAENKGMGSKVGQAIDTAKTAVDGAKNSINNAVDKVKDPLKERKKWYGVMKKARQDDNWTKNKLPPSWITRALIATSSNPGAKHRVKQFGKSSMDIKTKALKGQAKVSAGGSLEDAEKTMEDIKSIREDMQKLAPEIQKDLTEAMVEKIPQLKPIAKLGCLRFMPTELMGKIFGDNFATCTSCMPTATKMIIGIACVGGVIGLLVI